MTDTDTIVDVDLVEKYKQQIAEAHQHKNSILLQRKMAERRKAQEVMNRLLFQEAFT